MELFDFLYDFDACGVRHETLLNMDWSLNHSVTPANDCVLSNFNVHWGGREDKPLVLVRLYLLDYS